MPKCIANVVPVNAKFFSVSFSGIDVDFIDIRVRISDWDTSGIVSSIPSAAATAVYAGTPGIIS